MINKVMSVMEGEPAKHSPRFRTREIKKTQLSTPSLRFRPGVSFSDWNKVKLDNLNPKEKFHLNEPLRIPIPQFFNIPSFQHPLMKSKKTEIEGADHTYVLPQPLKDVTIPAQFSKKIKQLIVMRDAMKRAKQLKNEARCDYSLAVLYENLGNMEAAIDHYNKFLRIAVYFKDQKSIELAMNSLGIAETKLQKFDSAMTFHEKQIEISNDRNQFIGLVNIAKCHHSLGNMDETMKYLQRALELAKKFDDKYRADFAEEMIISYKERGSHISEQDTRDIYEYYSREASLNQNRNPETLEKVVKSHMRLGELSLSKKEYATSGAQYAKSIEFASMNSSPKSQAANKEFLKAIRLGYSISKAENSMNNYLDRFKKTLKGDQQKE